MSSDNKAKEIFLDAIEIANKSDRNAFVGQACGHDQPLRDQVERLIEAHFEADSLLDNPRIVERAQDKHELSPPETMPAQTVRSGIQIGPYKLLEQIGSGGMGVVYMAEQVKPIRRKVAVKIIKPGMDTAQVIARFEAERQALAMMDHPNIAHVLDAGTTEFQRPYFVMELVRGIPITDYCDKNKLTTQDRLKLFATVCQAVQHAHTKGIIHRDLKPSNILVTLHDGVPVPKIIDFGVAKATNQQLTDRTLFTSINQFVGTPLYMSPEQAELSGLDVDTRSDVYSLGVLLYELLTGTTPFDRQRLHEAGLDEVRRIIREEEPQKPSTRVSSMGNSNATVSASRGTDPMKLTQSLRHELDWIVMKTLEKDRTRRYETASALASEIHRYLNGETVEACPPSTAYRVRKFVHRHRVPVGVATAFGVVIIGSSILAWWLYGNASRSRDNALLAQKQSIAERDRAREAEQAAAINLELATREKTRADEKSTELKQRLYDFTIIKANAAYRDRDMSNLASLLSECLPEQRGWEWSFLNRQASGPRALKLPGTMNWEFAISPDMTRVVVIDDGGVVRCLALSDGSLLWSKKSEVLISSGCCISPDGRQFLVTGSRQIPEANDSAKQLNKCAMESFSMANGDVLWTEKPKGSTSFQPFFCHAGTKFLVTVAMSDTSSEVQLRSTADASLIWSTPALSIASTIMNQAGTKLFITEGQEIGHEKPTSIRCLNADDRKQLWKVDRPKEGSCLLLSPDESELIATGQNMALILYDANTGELKQRYKGPLNEAGVMVFGCNSRSHVLTVTPAGNVAVWNWQTKSSLETLKAASAFAAQLTNDGSQLAYLVGQANTLQLRPVRSTPDMLTLVGHQSGYKGARFLDPQHLCSVGPEGACRVWQTTTGQELMAKPMQATGLELTVAPDASWIAAATMKGTKVWDKATGNLLQDWPQDGPSWFVKRNAAGTLLATAGEQGILRVYETKNGAGPGPWSTKVESPSHEFKASGSIQGLAVSADGNALVTLDSPGCEVILWDVPSGKRHVLRTAQPGQMGRTIELSPDGRWLAVGVSQSVELWDLPSRKLVTTFRDAGVKVMSLTFDKTGSRLFAGTVNGMIMLWNLQSRERLLSFKAHDNFVVTLDMSPDNATLASSGLDGELRLWETQILSPEQAAQRDLVQRATMHANRLLVQHRTPKAALQQLLQADTIPAELMPAAMASLQARMDAPINLNALAAATGAKSKAATPNDPTAKTANTNRTLNAIGLKTRIDETLSKSMADILQPTAEVPSDLISDRWNTLCRSLVRKSTYDLEPAQLIALLQQIKDNGDESHYILYLKAIAHLQLAQWEMAETEMSSALALIPNKSPLWFTYAFRLSFLRAYVGKWDEYRQLCNTAIESYKDTKDSIILERLAKMCLFSKQAGIDMPTAAAIAARAHSENEYLGGRVYARMTLGLATLWQEKPAEAIEHFDYVIRTGIPGDKQGHDIFVALTKLYLAVAYHHVNRNTEALQQLEEASPVIESFPPTSGWWPDWMMACIVQKEVKALLR